MASVGSAFGAYLADSLKIFAIPVTTIRRASGRGLDIPCALFLLLLLTLAASALRLVISYVPGGLSDPLPVTDLVLEEVSFFLFFLLSLLVLFALVIVFGGKTNFGKLFSAKLSLASAIVGGFAVALLGKLLIGLFFLGANDGVAGGLVVLGEQFGLLAIGLILGVYTIIVARFGGDVSWVIAAIVGLAHVLLMVAIFAAYNVMILNNQFGPAQRLFQ